MRGLVLVIMLVIGIGSQASSTFAASPEALQLTAQIFRVRGNISGDTSLTDDVWAGKPPKGEEGKAISFFTIAKLSVAGHRLNVDERGWRWDDKPLPLGNANEAALPPLGENVLLLAAPRMVVPAGETAQLSISAEQGIEYFVHRDGNLYELRKSQQPTGLTLVAPMQRDPDGRIHLAGLVLTSRMIESRKPLEGTALNVGEPQVSTRTLTADVHLKPGRDYGFFYFTSDGQGTLLVRLRAETAPQGVHGSTPSGSR